VIFALLTLLCLGCVEPLPLPKGTKTLVTNALIKGDIEDLCGLRTGGWSLPGVMSD
jgi:hypothetical protein